MKAAGLFALGHPAELGGGGLTLTEYAFLNQVIGRSLCAMHALVTLTLQDSIIFRKFATPEQRELMKDPYERVPSK